jgi:hypothetical protein
MRLFVPCAPPRAADEVLGAGWYEWSPEARQHLIAMRPHLSEALEPVAVHRPDRPYGWACELPAPPEEGSPLWAHVEALSHGFYELRLPATDLALLCGVFEHGVEAKVVRYLFAALRHHLPRRHPRASSFNLPIEPIEPAHSAFPLHADLFPQRILCTVFDQVAEDETGASVLLNTRALDAVLATTVSMPADARARIQACFDDRGDQFEQLVDLLYNPRHPWTIELGVRLRAAQHRQRFRGGEGYVLHDRRWLHGRERLQFAFATTRLTRVAFDSAATLDDG